MEEQPYKSKPTVATLQQCVDAGDFQQWEVWSECQDIHDYVDDDNRGVLCWAAGSENGLKIIKDVKSKCSRSKFMEQVNRADEAGYKPLHIAVAHGFEDIVDFLLDCGANPFDTLYSSKNTALHIASSKGFANILMKLCARGDVDEIKLSLNAFGGTILDLAVSADQIDCASRIIDMDVFSIEPGILKIAQENNSEKMIALIIRAGGEELRAKVMNIQE